MKKITKNNLADFLTYYNNLHDSSIISINYDITKEKIELLLDIYNYSQEKPIKSKLKIIFNKIEKSDIKEIFSWDFIYEIYIKYITLENKELICFASSKENPNMYIVCNDIEYIEFI